jgi:fatty-acyl-CoA synthase
MRHSQLTLIPLLERAGTLFPTATIVSQRPDNSMHRYTYRDLYRRARALAAGLQNCGLRPGDRVATLMWNHHLHLEAYFGVPVVGGVLHTLNPRLHPDELAYIVNNAEDRFLIVDDVLLPAFENIKDGVSVERVIVAPFSGQLVPRGYEDYEVLSQKSSGNPQYQPPLNTSAVTGHVSMARAICPDKQPYVA